MRSAHRIALSVLAAAVIVSAVTGGFFALRHGVAEVTATVNVDEVVADVLAKRSAELLAAGDAPYGDDGTVNVLVLGIDSRKEGKEQHCDAIHMFQLNVRDWTMRVTSVPRGTYAYIPPGTYAQGEYYLANACAFAGLEYGVTQIERIVGVQADYVVTVGFSQALGVFRVLGLPTTESLQWLRHRQSYAIGDPQRSHNQAVFMKDVIVRFADDDPFPLAIQYLIYTFVHTDMDFATMRALYEGYAASGVTADDIALDMKPAYATVDYHLDLDNPDEQIATLLKNLEGRLSTEDLSGRSLADIQTELVDYLRAAITDPQEVAVVFANESWRQVEDAAVREELHYAFLEAYVRGIMDDDREHATQLVADYVLEKQTLGIADYEVRGRQLLAEIVQ